MRCYRTSVVENLALHVLDEVEASDGPETAILAEELCKFIDGWLAKNIRKSRLPDYAKKESW